MGADLAQHRHDVLLKQALGQKGVLGNLDDKPIGKSRGAEFLTERTHEREIAGLLRGNVDADPDSGTKRLIDQVHRTDDLPQSQERQIIDQAELGRQTDKLAGRLDHSAFIAQANERLDAHDLLRSDIDLWLEGAAESSVPNGQAQPLFLRHAHRHGAAHIGIEQRGTTLGTFLDAIHGAVRRPTQHLVAEPVIGIDAQPDRSRRQNLKSLDQKRLLELLQQVGDEIGKILVIFRRADDQQELVAADARKNVGWPNMRRYSLRDLHQKRVTDRVGVIVVDVLEVVDVQKRQREPPRGLRTLQQKFDMLLNQPAIWQSGQIVEIGAS